MGRQQDTALEARIAELEAKLASAERGYALQIEAMAASHGAAMERERAEFEERLARGLSDMESRHSRQMAALEAEHGSRIDALNAEHAAATDALNARINNLLEAIRRANGELFGRRTDRIDPLQLSLFNDVEFNFEGHKDIEEPRLATPRKRKRGGRRAINTENMERIVIEHVLKAGQDACPQCGGTLEDVKCEVREVIRLVPAHFVVEEHRRHLYRCPKCCEKNAEGKEVDSVLRRAEAPAMPLGKSFASPSLLAHVLNAKYVNAMPLYRIESDLRSIDENMALSRQLLASWVIQCHGRWFYRICERIKEKILEGRLVHADETGVLVLKEPGREPWKKSQMWVFAAPQGLTPACLFEYHPSRGRDVVLEFFKGWSGTVMSDGLASYYNNKGIENLSCLVHLRRGFVKVIEGLDENSLAKTGSLAHAAVKLMDNIFAIDARFDGMGEDGRKAARERELAPALDAFGSWLREKRGEVLASSKLACAFDNCIGHWPVLKDGLFPLSNNLAERLIRPFAVGRKNWLFSDTVNGARASAAIYSIVATARGNGLVPVRYLEWLLTEMPNEKDLDAPGAIERFMPWADGLPNHLFADAKANRIAADTPLVDIDPHALDDIDLDSALGTGVESA